MSFRLVGTELLERWYEVEPDSTRHVLMNDWLADLLDDPGGEPTAVDEIRD